MFAQTHWKLALLVFLCTDCVLGQSISDFNGGLGSSFTFGNISGTAIRTSPSAGAGANLDIGGLPGNGMPQTWWWYRIDTPTMADTREYALSNQMGFSVSGNSAGFQYDEPRTSPRIRFDVGYVVADDADPQGCLIMGSQITNIDSIAHDLTLYLLVDPDIRGPAGDSAVLSAPAVHASDGADLVRVEPILSPGPRWFEVGDVANLTAELSNATLESTFANGGLPYSGGNFAVVYKWSITGLQPGGLAFNSMNVCFNLGQVPCAGDVNGDLHNDLSDLAILLSKFGQTGANLPCDLNGDFTVNIADLALLLSAFGC